MHIQVKKGGPEGQKLSVAERQDRLSKKEELENQLTDPNSQHLIQNRSGLQAQLNKINEDLQKDESNQAKGTQKDRAVKRIKELDAQIRKIVNPVVCQQVKPGTDEYEAAIKAGMEASEPEVTKLVEERQNLKRFVEPDDPNSGSLETIVKGESKL